jgi:bacteriorhodopsin
MEDPRLRAESLILERATNFKATRITFYITYVLLLTTATITFIEALRTDNAKVRHVMNLETAISLVAAYFYGRFIEMVKGKFKVTDITQTRYVDWAITTPLLLLVLNLVYSNVNRTSLSVGFYGLLVLLNYGMLGAGYAGETGTLPHRTSQIVGFAFFFLMFYLIYAKHVSTHFTTFNIILFAIYIGLWGMYGVAAEMDDDKKNATYNILDLCAKCFTGLGFWAYFSKIFA